MKQPLIVIAGPTACGKTAVSVELCLNIGGEVVSADSMQIYRHMDIGTAKIKEEEKKGVPHFLIDELEPYEEYSAAIFQARAKSCISGIAERKHMPVLVGGTGFYINALLYNNDFTEGKRDNSVRERLEAELRDYGKEHLFERLMKTDPEYCRTTHPNNIKRVMRALEFYEETGKRFSEHNAGEKKRELYYDSTVFVLSMDRKKLYERIDRRVDKMIEDGLEKEVRMLMENGAKREYVSMQGLGYKEMAAYISGEISFDEAVYILKRDTRHFAKRQLTWFRRQLEGAIWIDLDEYEDIEAVVSFMISRIGDKYGLHKENIIK